MSVLSFKKFVKPLLIELLRFIMVQDGIPGSFF